jgi:hypothetical protein
VPGKVGWFNCPLNEELVGNSVNTKTIIKIPFYNYGKATKFQSMGKNQEIL